MGFSRIIVLILLVAVFWQCRVLITYHLLLEQLVFTNNSIVLNNSPASNSMIELCGQPKAEFTAKYNCEKYGE